MHKGRRSEKKEGGGKELATVTTINTPKNDEWEGGEVKQSLNKE